jgi:ketosteroid isomerase-like protein
MDIEARIARLEAESAIRKVIALYCFTIDDRDLSGLAALFTEDARVASEDGVMEAHGIEAIMNQYRGRFEVLGPGAHYMHDIALEFTPGRADEATGRISGHFELWRCGTMMVAGLRYRDQYRLTPKGWRFAERIISFLYYVPIDQYPGILGHLDRNRAYAESKPADFPERLASWNDYDTRGARR